MSSDILPTARFPPHRSRPTGYPPNRQPATVGAEERGGKDTTSSRTTTGAAHELNPPKSACAGDAVLRTSTRGTVPMGQCAAPAPGAPSPWDSALGAIEDSISQCTFLQMTYTAETPHADGSAAPGARPRYRPPRHSDLHDTSRTHDNRPCSDMPVSVDR